jgi:hypothetical protein
MSVGGSAVQGLFQPIIEPTTCDVLCNFRVFWRSRRCKWLQKPIIVSYSPDLSKIIASYLSISDATVKAHLKNIMHTLGASDRTTP